MKQAIKTILAILLSLPATAQGIHFSQYYNSPMLLNPANTALLPDNDYRLGMNYRNQWSSVPVPYRTFSAYADFGVMRSKNETNWLGLGLALFNDVAGNGNLSLTRIEGFAAYHVMLGESNMISVGLSAGNVQRSVDFNKLTFDMQWDGFSFDGTLPSGEKPGIAKTSYVDLGAGINYAYFPNENVYVKLGAGLAHLNTPKESFYGLTNTMDMRPTGNIDALVRAGKDLIINPSVYYTTQHGASELLYGTLLIFNLDGRDARADRLILGAYHRLGDAIVATAGYEYSGFRLMVSYDVTISELAPYNNRNGAMEIGLRWEGRYHNDGGMVRKTFSCPRF